MQTPRTGGRLVVDQLVIHGAGSGVLRPRRELPRGARRDVRRRRDRIRLINARHEAGAANMAEAYGKLTGRPGVAMVTRAGRGRATRRSACTPPRRTRRPMVLLVGQIERRTADRETFQEVDYRQMFGPLAKCGRAGRPRRARAGVRRGGRSTSPCRGGRGRSCWALPEDMLTDAVEVADAAAVRREPGRARRPGDPRSAAPAARGRRAADRPARRLAVERRGVARRSRRSPRPGTYRWPRRSAGWT